ALSWRRARPAPRRLPRPDGRRVLGLARAQRPAWLPAEAGGARGAPRGGLRKRWPVSPFLAIFVGGALGGIISGLVISVALVLFGRRVAEDLLQQQISDLETRFKENILEAVLGRVASFLNQGERIGQIVKRVVEILQLVLRRGTAEDSPVLDAAGLAQRQATLGAALAAVGRTEEARPVFEEALRLDKGQAIALQGLRDLAAFASKPAPAPASAS